VELNQIAIGTAQSVEMLADRRVRVRVPAGQDFLLKTLKNITPPSSGNAFLRNVSSYTDYCMRWAGHVARVAEKQNAYKLLMGKPEGKRPLGRPRRRWVDNIRMDLGRGGMG
jgi:hypothetical protein